VIGVSVFRSGRRPKVPYTPALAVELRQHFESVAQEVDKLVTQGQTKNLPMPSLVAFAVQRGLHTSQMYRWARKHPELAQALAFCRQLQLDFGQIAEQHGWSFVFEDCYGVSQ
jgi:hypothetical protein